MISAAFQEVSDKHLPLMAQLRGVGEKRAVCTIRRLEDGIVLVWFSVQGASRFNTCPLCKRLKLLLRDG